MKKLFLAASGFFAAVPGVAIFLKGIGAPPEHSLIFGGVIEAFGAITFLVLLVNKDRVKNIGRGGITKIALALCAACFLSIAIYTWLYKLCVVPYEANKWFYFPLWTSGELARLVENAGGRSGAIDVYGPATVYEALEQMPSWIFAVTTGVLLLVYQFIFTSLTSAFGILGFHSTDDL